MGTYFRHVDFLLESPVPLPHSVPLLPALPPLPALPLPPSRAGTPATPKTPTALANLVTAASPSASTRSLVDVPIEQGGSSSKITQVSSRGPRYLIETSIILTTESSPFSTPQKEPLISQDDIPPLSLSGEANNTRSRSPFKFITSPFSSSSV
jgi:hypothetical protein